MTDFTLPILQNPDVLQRTSSATRRVMEQRAAAIAAPRFLTAELYAMLQQVVGALLPQAAIGTDVDVAAAIDMRLADGKGAGWRFAELPADGEAYVRGLTVFAEMLQQTPMKTFERMPAPAREGYLRCVANGDVDGPARFALSKWLLMLKTDAVTAWLSHPAAMEAIEYYGFADGETGLTNGPTKVEGWQGITTNKALPFEVQRVSESASQRVSGASDEAGAR